MSICVFNKRCGRSVGRTTGGDDVPHLVDLGIVAVVGERVNDELPHRSDVHVGWGADRLTLARVSVECHGTSGARLLTDSDSRGERADPPSMTGFRGCLSDGHCAPSSGGPERTKHPVSQFSPVRSSGAPQAIPSSDAGRRSNAVPISFDDSNMDLLWEDRSALRPDS